MLITRVELENIKSYRHLNIDLRRGTTAICGANGAGKTTIVEAIGFALFDFIPYKQTHFIREGEKYGKIVVHLIGGDDREYSVERRVGSGSYWFVYDKEADYRVEQRVDVLDKLHELFGIDRDRNLEALFRDALGVPQGSFTSIFLETAARRKQTFDALLQIEDYRAAADNLLETQRLYQEQINAQQARINQLEFETREMDVWRDTLTQKRQAYQQNMELETGYSERLTEAQRQVDILKQQQDEVRRLAQQRENSKSTWESNQQRLSDRASELRFAQEAVRAVEANREGYQRYLRADEILHSLRQDEKTRNQLRQQLTMQSGERKTVQTKIGHLQKQLEEVAEAKQRVLDFVPLVEKQEELEKQRDEWMAKVKEYNRIVAEGKKLVSQYNGYQSKLQEIQQKITVVEPLQGVAALLNERIEILTKLRSDASNRSIKSRELVDLKEQLQRKFSEREKLTLRLRKVEKNIQVLEEHRAEAEELPELEQQLQQLAEQRYRLEGNIEGYLKSRKQSLGGQCPLLQETCLNISRRGSASLESYFDGLIAEDKAHLDDIIQQQQAIEGRIQPVKKYADALLNLGNYIEMRDRDADQLQRLALEITRLERDILNLEEALEAMKQIHQEIARAEALRDESQKASNQVSELNGLRVQVQQLQELSEECNTTIQELRQQVGELKGSQTQLSAVEQQLKELNDPRAQTRAQYAIIKREDEYAHQMTAEMERLTATEKQLVELKTSLQAYEQLDAQISEQENTKRQCDLAYRTYLGNEKNAAMLPQREQAYQEMQRITEESLQAYHRAEEVYEQARSAFQEEDLQRVSDEVEKLGDDIRNLRHEMRQLQLDIQKLEQDIAQGEVLLQELGEARQEKETLDDLHKMMEQFRRLIKDAAPYVLQAMLRDISAEANRIFGEIMGDRSAQLSWENDYEITIRRQGNTRTFAQLSGGEQMSAALSVRLALLKKLSTLNLAFFDEPTQNMDEMRRVNLAEQIRRVRGFDQLIVISHDDTFEQGLDSLVRLRKVNGETVLVSEDEQASHEHELLPAESYR